MFGGRGLTWSCCIRPGRTDRAMRSIAVVAGIAAAGYTVNRPARAVSGQRRVTITLFAGSAFQAIAVEASIARALHTIGGAARLASYADRNCIDVALGARCTDALACRRRNRPSAPNRPPSNLAERCALVKVRNVVLKIQEGLFSDTRCLT